MKTADGWRKVGKSSGKTKDAHDTVHGKETKEVTILGDLGSSMGDSDDQINAGLKKLGIKVHIDYYGDTSYLVYKDKKVLVKVDRLYDQIGYLKSRLEELGFTVKKNQFGDLKIS